MYIIILGGPDNGFQYIGLFDSFTEAINYIETNGIKSPWWIQAILDK